MEQLKKAVENAATFIAIEPSDVTMADNIRYYKSELKIPNEFFNPRDVSLNIYTNIGILRTIIATNTEL